MSAVAPEAIPAVGGSSSHRRSPRQLLLAVSQYLGFAPAMVLFGLFFLAPMGLIVAYSFWTQDGYNVVSTWTSGRV